MSIEGVMKQAVEQGWLRPGTTVFAIKELTKDWWVTTVPQKLTGIFLHAALDKLGGLQIQCQYQFGERQVYNHKDLFPDFSAAQEECNNRNGAIIGVGLSSMDDDEE